MLRLTTAFSAIAVLLAPFGLGLFDTAVSGAAALGFYVLAAFALVTLVMGMIERDWLSEELAEPVRHRKLH
ncbi:MAG TPA: hypothetical protein PLD57_10130 [Aggregatilineales bacterium]|nr:hypothetical protein [Chloroflexota bacterium]HOA23987.1 hypothetical protein [Aggregatilineales bacterium]HPV07420.1 hypothetical protein [Aggregatilineales bacterium]HQE20078.1 hypothetical protein [Aggregatilineales bacterium]